MRHFVPVGFGLFSILTCMPVGAQEATKAALPDTTVCPAPIADATCYSAKHASGAYLLAAMPKNWNGHLIVFAHGGPHIVPPTATTSQPDLAKYSIGVRQGFAWVASTYRREGYGVLAAAEDSEHARQFFVDRIARPRRTIFHGASWGGLVGSSSLKSTPKARTAARTTMARSSTAASLPAHRSATSSAPTCA